MHYRECRADIVGVAHVSYAARCTLFVCSRSGTSAPFAGGALGMVVVGVRKHAQSAAIGG